MPRTEQPRKTRAEKRRAGRAKRRARQAEGATAQVAMVGSPQPAELQTAPSAAAAPTAATIAEAPEYSTQEIVGAIGQLAGIVNDLKESMIGAVGELHNRIATIEQAQQQGLLTLGEQSGLGMLGLSGGPQDQGALIQSSDYRAIKEVEQQILSEEGYNLPDPADDHVVLVGAVNEEIVRSRREAIHKAINEQQGGLLR